MSNFLIDEMGNHVWYDLESNEINLKQKIAYLVRLPNQPVFYIRYHRENGPAVICTDGREAYYIKGELHRDDGPAMVFDDGDFVWCINDREYLFETWCEKLNKTEEEITYMKLKWNII